MQQAKTKKLLQITTSVNTAKYDLINHFLKNVNEEDLNDPLYCQRLGDIYRTACQEILDTVEMVIPQGKFGRQILPNTLDPEITTVNTIEGFNENPNDDNTVARQAPEQSVDSENEEEVFNSFFGFSPCDPPVNSTLNKGLKRSFPQESPVERRDLPPDDKQLGKKARSKTIKWTKELWTKRNPNGGPAPPALIIDAQWAAVDTIREFQNCKKGNFIPKISQNSWFQLDLSGSQIKENRGQGKKGCPQPVLKEIEEEKNSPSKFNTGISSRLESLFGSVSSNVANMEATLNEMKSQKEIKLSSSGIENQKTRARQVSKEWERFMSQFTFFKDQQDPWKESFDSMNFHQLAHSLNLIIQTRRSLIKLRQSGSDYFPMNFGRALSKIPRSFWIQWRDLGGQTIQNDEGEIYFSFSDRSTGISVKKSPRFTRSIPTETWKEFQKLNPFTDWLRNLN